MMRANQLALAALVTFSLAAASACEKQERGAKSATSEITPTTAASRPAETEPKPSMAADEDPVEAALAEYESIRAALARDDIAAAANAAHSLKEKAASAAGVATGERRPHFKALTRAAETLAASSPDEEAAARNAFGKISRAVVALLADTPELREGRHLFECPMVTGFNKWVQRDAQLANPYMGQKMLRCGSASEWEVGEDTPFPASGSKNANRRDADASYSCVMHPQQRSQEAGACPVCGMDMLERPQDADNSHHRHEHGTGTYACSMHPEETSDEAGATCSVCGMDMLEQSSSTSPR